MICTGLCQFTRRGRKRSKESSRQTKRHLRDDNLTEKDKPVSCLSSPEPLVMVEFIHFIPEIVVAFHKKEPNHKVCAFLPARRRGAITTLTLPPAQGRATPATAQNISTCPEENGKLLFGGLLSHSEGLLVLTKLYVSSPSHRKDKHNIIRDIRQLHLKW